MNTSYFINCQSLEEVKKLFKELALKHHPDRGGETATMQEINADYEKVIKKPFYKFNEQTEKEQSETLLYPEIISQLMGMHGIIIELLGNWIWVSGNTFPHRKKLGGIGFFFARKKLMWYWRPEEYKAPNRRPKPIELIRAKYGSENIQVKNFEEIEG